MRNRTRSFFALCSFLALSACAPLIGPAVAQSIALDDPFLRPGEGPPTGSGAPAGTLQAAALRAEVLYGQPSGLLPAGEETVRHTATLEHRPRDPWLGRDKAQHLAFSFLWTLGTQYVLVNKGNATETGALPVSASVAASVGLAKEYYDWRVSPSRYFSTRDLAADALGILLAAGLILL